MSCQFINDNGLKCNKPAFEKGLCEEHRYVCKDWSRGYHECKSDSNQCNVEEDYIVLNQLGAKYDRCRDLRKKVSRQCFAKDDSHELAYYTDKHRGLDCFAKACEKNVYEDDESDLEKYENCKHLHEKALKVKSKMKNLSQKLKIKNPPYFELFTSPNDHVKKSSEYKNKKLELQKRLGERQQAVQVEEEKVTPKKKSKKKSEKKKSEKKKSERKEKPKEDLSILGTFSSEKVDFNKTNFELFNKIRKLYQKYMNNQLEDKSEFTKVVTYWFELNPNKKDFSPEERKIVLTSNYVLHQKQIDDKFEELYKLSYADGISVQKAILKYLVNSASSLENDLYVKFGEYVSSKLEAYQKDRESEKIQFDKKMGRTLVQESKSNMMTGAELKKLLQRK